MSFLEKIKNKISGLSEATGRFPLTTLFLVAATITNIIDINSPERYRVYLISLIVGAFLSATGQIMYERFFKEKVNYRYIFMVLSALLSFGYYLIVKDSPDFSIELSVRTGVALFAVLIAFIWIPSVKREVTFNESFMISFKGYFISVFFSGVIFLGVALIIGAVDQLLFSVNSKIYSYNATIVFFIFAPLFFLSMIPLYPEKPNEETEKYSNIPRLLEVLISYIIIPISAIFTVILIIYIILNIRGEFWTNNLLEPMLVSYSIAIILIYILSSMLENKFAVLFRKFAPKILVPIVVFQVIASILKVGEMGITYGRYYAVLYGIYAAIAGGILSFVPVKRNGLIAALLIIFSVISIVPPIDAFSVSKSSQLNTLENTLIANEMLVNGEIVAKPDLNNEEKMKIINSMNYLYRMEYLDKVSFLPDDFEFYNDFYATFGFREYEGPDGLRETVFVNLAPGQALNIEGYNYMGNIHAAKPNQDFQDDFQENQVIINHQGMEYKIVTALENEDVVVNLLDKENNLMISFPVRTIVDRYYNKVTVNNQISLEEAAFKVENENVSLGIIVQDFFIDKYTGKANYWGNLVVLTDFK
jgi:MFS family permease